MDRKIVDYHIISRQYACLEAFCEDIKKAVYDGWQPFGNFKNVEGFFYQTLVKYEEEIE